MNDIVDYGVTRAVNLLATIFLILLLLCGGLLIVLVWILIQAGMEWADRQVLLREAQAVFDRVRAEASPDLQMDPLLRAIFGQDVDLPEADASDPGDWLTRAIFETV